MAKFIVRVWGEPLLVTTNKKSETVWVASGECWANGTVARTEPKTLRLGNGENGRKYKSNGEPLFRP
jgi:hypothetical protein